MRERSGIQAEAEPHRALSFEEKLQEADGAEDPDAWREVCIYKVPRGLRDANPKAFEPQFVSIGPYHHGKKEVIDMEMHKRRSFLRILKREQQEASLYLNHIREFERKARSCYQGTITLSVDEFVETMVIDGCFLLEIFFGLPDKFVERGYSEFDPVYGNNPSMSLISEDVLKLENQLPIFILVRLLDLMGEYKTKNNKTELVIRKALDFFDMKERDPTPFVKCSHCLEIYWKSLSYDISVRCRSTLDRNGRPGTTGEASELGSDPELGPKHETIHCLTKLIEAGVKLKKRKTKCLFDIKFESGVLHIPEFQLDDKIKRDFPNLIALEQCHWRSCKKYITSYAIFMDDLVDSAADVSHLHDHGIINNYGGGSYEKTADFYNRIDLEVGFDPGDSYLAGVTTGLLKWVNKYHDSKPTHWKVHFKRKYLSHPWTIFSLIAAAALLILAFLQTFCAMNDCHKQN